MLSVFSGGRGRIAEETPEYLKIGPIDDDDIQAVCDAVGIVWSGRVRSELIAGRDEGLMLKIAKIPSVDGLFLPPLHPLVRRALCVTLNSFGHHEEKAPPLCLRMESLPADYLAIFDYVCNAAGRTQSALAYWWSSGGRTERVTGDQLSRVIASLETCEMKIVEPVGLSPDLRRSLELDFEAWCDSVRPKQLGPPSDGTAVPRSAVEHIATIYPG